MDNKKIINEKQDLIGLGKLLSEFVVGMEGNVSKRPKSGFVIKSSGSNLKNLTESSLISYDQKWNQVDCLTSFPCICSRVTNHASVSNTYDYLDCDGSVQTITIPAGEQSDRICMAHWLSSYPTDYVEYFGDCSIIADVHTCPPTIYPVRHVRPGYNTPSCDAEKWDKITCKSSEILYKSVLKGRYGISNCCDEPTDKWLIKKELIDLAALVDPDYICTGSTCGCPPSSCGCGCGTTLKTCNSN